MSSNVIHLKEKQSENARQALVAAKLKELSPSQVGTVERIIDAMLSERRADP